ncbi:16675_t:CDS:2, partial [Gigaspora rosea]
MKLLTQDSLTTEEPYLKHIRLFNSGFFFISMGASIDPELANGAHAVYTYHLQGAIYHRIGSLLPDENCIPKFSQIYIYDGSFDTELSCRHTVFPFLDYDLLADIQQDLHTHNPFARIFRSAGQSVHRGQPIILRLLSGQGFDIRRYNRPTADKIAVLLIDNNADSGMHTKLTKFFEVCRVDSTAANLLYTEFPKFFRWVKGAWIRRKRSGNKVIGRLHSFSPSDSERFCLRLLLYHIRGPTLFESLRTVNGVTFSTFKQAAQQLGLLESDQDWHVKSLWDTYLPDLTEDFIYEAWQHGENVVPEDPLIISHALVEIEGHCRQCGKYLMDFPELPTIQHDLLNIDRQTNLFAEESSFSQDELQRILERVSMLTDEQCAIYDV